MPTRALEKEVELILEVSSNLSFKLPGMVSMSKVFRILRLYILVL